MEDVFEMGMEKLVMKILFPSSYMNSRRADEAFEREYEAALAAGLEVMLFHQQLWDEKREIRLDFEKQGQTLYRGWMVKPEDYQIFHDRLWDKGIKLLTDPDQYETMHIFPNVYKWLAEDTPKTLFFPLHARMDVEEIRRELGEFMVKDYVKSAKNTDFPVYFDRDISQTEFDRWMERFYEIRGELLTGGILAKQYVKLKKYGGHTNEYRVFYLRGQLISVCRNSLQPDYAAELPGSLAEKYAMLPSPFYTVDYAEKEDGQWVVVEAGDGGVSGLSERQDYEAFFRAVKILSTIV